MPFNDGQFNLVVFDPPHLFKAGKKSWLALKQGSKIFLFITYLPNDEHKPHVRLHFGIVLGMQ
ncbi:hypothetical protein F990_03122 [Acinetobacter tjernbergiae DSM 14971 = CIP 107465]|uniref:Uncharacterized protein n=1 Tax=Acinetobacter tjernbergiae DSM 14971 = CIP 107465 TaxID=1120928 RepID=V2UV33_9GAMM|nr:hypothetical protein F990_03122 [Acinetobacter tjernbergiae DSM 14971 = CIP 107465]